MFSGEHRINTMDIEPRKTWFERFGPWVISGAVVLTTIIGTSWQYRVYVDSNTSKIESLQKQVYENTKECIKADSERQALNQFLYNLKKDLEKRLDKIELKLDRIKRHR